MSRPPPLPKHLQRVSAPVQSFLQQHSAGSDSAVPSRTYGLNLGRASVGANVPQQGKPALNRSSLQKAFIELESRGEFHGNVDFSVQILDAETGRPVMYKFDGSRFHHSDATIKVSSNVMYDVNVSMKPALEVVDGIMTLQAVLPDGTLKVDLIELGYKSREERILTGSWRCTLPASKKNKRVHVTLSGKLKEFGEFEIPIMLKVYAYEDSHKNQGFALKQITSSLKRVADDSVSKVKRMSVRFMN
ncbi:hypothetical protein BSKO_00955 [Bryopsis sp. KO-2023]|nr:hypothetical protein BSKO_00955 [Bryopsis sp. KO-2023]